MPSTTVAISPSLSSFLKSLKTDPVESSVEHLISLLKRRQIRSSRPCAIATSYLLLRVVSAFRWTNVEMLILRIQQVGQRLCAAQPREMVVGNIVRRVLGLIREEAEDDRDGDASVYSDAGTDSPGGSPQRRDTPPMVRSSMSTHLSAFSPLRQGAMESPEAKPVDVNTGIDGAFTGYGAPDLGAGRPPLLTSHPSYAANASAPMATSMFSLLSHEGTSSSSGTPVGARSPTLRSAPTASSLARDLKPDIMGGIEEIIDELGQVDDQIAAYALDHIHANETVLTYSSSMTVQKFLLKAATKRKFTVIQMESYPNDHEATYATITGKRTGVPEDEDELSTSTFHKTLTAAGITVILITDAAVFAIMARVNKVILGTHAVLANGGLIAAAGAETVAKAAQKHRTPVVVVSGVYKLSPVYPFDFEELIEYGDPSKVFGYEDGDLLEKVYVDNPLFDYVPAEKVDLYITNLGGHAPSYLYRIVQDHYRVEDITL
ncbi:MAG: GCD complex subunit gcd7 [Thelocarpon superellum]|nr:MAG: GCD complex subunit gcd7 [Thelocarpon superellum]